jgi:hypothetical protein
MYYSTYNEYPKSLQELVGRGMIDQGALRDYWQLGCRTEIEGTDLGLPRPGPDRFMNTKDTMAPESLWWLGERKSAWAPPLPKSEIR